jgi:TfoX/Sxy family transcriptional regulator of competence genes
MTDNQSTTNNQQPMAYNEQLANQVRESLRSQPIVEEKAMMGGLVFMVDGKMCVGVTNDDLMVRLDPNDIEAALEKRGARQMDFTGTPMKSFLFIGPEGTSSGSELRYWIDLALAYNPFAKASKKKAKK